jgi:hypothetical protein
MPTVGNTATPAGSWKWTGWNSENNVAQSFTMPETGFITSVSVYVAGHDAGVSIQVGIWNAAGTLLASAPAQTAAIGTHVTGGQAWYTGILSTVVLVTAGDPIYIGWWADPATVGAREREWSYSFTGTSATSTTANSTAIGNLGATTSYAGQGLGAYGTYNLPAYVRRAGAWVITTPRVRRSSAWSATTTPTWVRRAGVWVRVGG